MKKSALIFTILFAVQLQQLLAGTPHNFQMTNDVIPIRSIFMQNGNINTVFRTDGYFNYDKVTFSNGSAGFIWPAAASTSMTAIYTTGIFVGAKYVLPGNQKELRLAASFYNSHFSPGNIPVLGQVPPVSVCNDNSFNGYLVNLVDQTLVNGGTRTKVAGGRTYTFNYAAWSSWPVNQGAPYVEVNNVPGYQPGWTSDRPGIGIGTTRPTEVIFMVYMDYKNCTGDVHQTEISLPGGTLPLGVEIQQLSYMFEINGFQDVYFTSYKIINKSTRPWDSTYVSLVNDGDIGDAVDDVVGCDTLRNTAYTYNGDNLDPLYGSAPPAVSYRVLQGPVVFTGNNNDTAKLPCSNKVQYRMLQMSGHNRFINAGGGCLGDPDIAENAYNFMRGMDGCGNPVIDPNTGQPTKYVFSGNPCTGSGWRDLTPSDKRNLINSGPFTMNSGDTQVVAFLFSIARGSDNIQSVCQSLSLSDYAKTNYYNCFNLIGITNLNSNVPAVYSLEQNYPNPFNPVTNFKFGIPAKGFVKVAVYDAVGREITVLVNSEMPAGSYSVDWNASDYPSGVYFYRLSSGDYSETKKMVLVK